MTPELDKYYSERFSMMSMDGWKDLTIDIDNMIESLNNISVIPDEKTLMFRKGELSILTWLKTWFPRLGRSLPPCLSLPK